jgi:hypothetical protein
MKYGKSVFGLEATMRRVLSVPAGVVNIHRQHLNLGHFDTVFLSDFVNLSLRMGEKINKQTDVSCNIAILISTDHNSPLFVKAIIR